MAQITVDDILPRLLGVRRTRSGWVARCPAHDDQHQSLSIGIGATGKVLLKCHAGCSFQEILGALGISGTPSSSWDGLPEDANRLWVYRWADGTPAMAVARWDGPNGKKIRPFRPVNDRWEPGAPAKRPCLHLQELLKAKADIPIWVVEGEKCVDALRAAGALATTSPGGAQAASKADWSWAKGREIVLWPDNDEAGRRYAADVAQLCYEAGAKRVRCLPEGAVQLPPGGDAADLATDQLRDLLPMLLATAVDMPAPEQQPAQQTVGEKRKPTDADLARSWLAVAGPAVWSVGSWYVWTGRIWQEQAREQIDQSILFHIESICREFGLSLGSGRIRSVREVAESLAYRTPEWWDEGMGWWPCQNATIDLERIEPTEHHQDHKSTFCAPYAYDPRARPETWLRVLMENVADQETIEFLQEYAGYCLTGDTSLERAVWLHGPPGSGKSTIVAGFEALLGAACVPLGLQEIERTPFALCKLIGRRLAVATEQPAEFVRSTSLISAIISGEPIMIDLKYRDPVILRPRAKILWACNDLPRTSEVAAGIFRRVAIVQCCRKVSQPDTTLRKKLTAEASGILNWALEGLRRLRQRGNFCLPAAVQATSDEYRESCDVTAAFAAERLIFEELAEVRAATLYQEYRQWCDENGHKPKSSTAMAAEWRRLGLRRDRDGLGTFYRGAKIKSNVL